MHCYLVLIQCLICYIPFCTDCPMPSKAYSLEKQMLTLRGTLGTIYDYDYQPVPFAYWNMVSWLLVTYLPLNAYALGWHYYSEWYFSWFGVVMTNFCLLGLCALAQQLSKPYGDDLFDFDVFHFLNFTCNASRKLLKPQIKSAASPGPEPGVLLIKSAASPSPEPVEGSFRLAGPSGRNSLGCVRPGCPCTGKVDPTLEPTH